MAGGLWAVFWDGPLDGDTRTALAERLGPEDRARFAAFPSGGGKSTERGRQFLLSRALLAFALEETLGGREPPILAKDAGGRPFLPEWPGLFLSLSHTAGAAVLALSDAPVGVDVERLRAIPPRLGRRVGAGTPEAFWRQWTAAEAEAKRAGRGAGAILAALRGAEEAAGDGGPLQKPGADVCPIPLGPGFAAAVCGEGDFPLRIVTGEELAE